MHQRDESTFVLTRRLRPDWAKPIAVLLAIPTLGLSLLLLRLRSDRVGTIALTSGSAGLYAKRYLKLSGQLPESLLPAIEGLLADRRVYASADGTLVDPPTAAESGAWTESSVVSTAGGGTPIPTTAPERGGRRASRGIALPRSDADVNATVSRRRVIDLSTAAAVLRFDNFASVTVHSSALIGRAPSADRNEPTAQLVPILDPGLSMSKTHLAVGVNDRGFWVCDRNSTNGSAVTAPDGTKSRCIPGVRHYVDAGSTVHMGDRSFSVLSNKATVTR